MRTRAHTHAMLIAVSGLSLYLPAGTMTDTMRWNAMRAANEAAAARAQAEATSQVARMHVTIAGYQYTSRPGVPTNFYISTSSIACDTNSGLSETAPWRSLERVNATELMAGDSVLFERGCEWRGQIVRSNLIGTVEAPIRFTAYGEGDKPIVNGSVLLTGTWQIVSVACGSTVYGLQLGPEVTNGYSLTQLIIDGVQAVAARQPDGGWRRTENAHLLYTLTNNGNYYSSIAIEDTDIASETSLWDGATIVINPSAWNYLQVRTVCHTNGVHGGILPLSGLFTNLFQTDFSDRLYFITDDIDATDSHGEWYYGRAENVLYLCWTNGTPDDHIIEASIFGAGVLFYKSCHIQVDSLDVRNTARDGIAVVTDFYQLENAGIRIVSNIVTCVHGSGIFTHFGSGYTIEYNQVLNSCLNGITVMYAYTNISVKGNSVYWSGLILTTENEQDSVGIKQISLYDPYWGTTDARIVRNTVVSNGYCGVMISGERSCAEENFVAWNGLLFGESQGIGTGGWGWRGNARQIAHNTVLHTVGGQDDQILYRLTTGIVSDICGTNIVVASNTVIDCGIAISLNNTPATIEGNLLHRNCNTWFSGLFRTLVSLGEQTLRARLLRNTFVTGEDGEYAIVYRIGTDCVMGTPECMPCCESNYYCNISLDSAPQFALTDAVYTLGEWRALTGNDVYSLECSASLRAKLGEDINSTVAYNSSSDVIVYDPQGLFYYDITCGVVKTVFTLPPFASRALFSNGYWPLHLPCVAPVLAYTGQPVHRSLPVQGGRPPYRWQIVEGGVPPPLTLSNEGNVTGTPTNAGTFLFTAQVTDDRTDTAEADYTLQVMDGCASPGGGAIGLGNAGYGSVGQ